MCLPSKHDALVRCTYLPRLKDYPQYCQHITCIDHFKEFPAHLVEWVEYGVQSAAPPSKPHGPVLPPQLEALIKGQAAAAAPVSLPSARAAAAGTVGGPKQPATSMPSAAAIGTAVSSAAAATTTVAAAAASSAPGSGGANAIVRPTPIAVGGRPSIANTTNIDTLLNARSKVRVEKTG